MNNRTFTPKTQEILSKGWGPLLNKKTYILCLTKKNKNSDVQLDPVFTYLVSEIGETRDVNRFTITQDDLMEAVTLYSFFKGNKSQYAKINKDKRCKIQPIKEFDPDEHWSIDRWWSKEDKIELGILEEDNIVNVEEFADKLGSISETISEFKNILVELNSDEVPVKKKTYKKIALDNEQLFQLFIGKRILKRDIFNTSGTIPIYSANVLSPMGYSNKSNISDFNSEFVLWGIDGNYEFNYIPKNTPFTTTDHCGSIRIKDIKILPAYLMCQLQSVKHKYGFDRSLRASLKNMKKIEINIPVDENNNFDVEIQKAIVKKYEVIQELKKEASDYQEEIQKLTISTDIDSQSKNIPLDKLFTISRGVSKYTKKYGDSNKGKYPVYSASNNKPLTYIDSYDYDGEYLTWATNGFAGYIKNLNEKFSINADRGILIPLDDKIYIQYIKFVLEPLLRGLAKGRKGEKGEAEFTKVYPSMIENIAISMPIKSDGTYDLDRQRKLAEYHQNINDVKESIVNTLEEVVSLDIEFVG